MKRLTEFLGGMLFAATLCSNAFADDIFKGVRGPERWQLDSRVSYARNENTETVTKTFILKYFEGDELGIWGFAALPYKFSSETRGMGDITMGFGPRGRVSTGRGDVHWIAYGGLAVPAGAAGKSDKKTGAFITYLSPDAGFEVDGSLEYTFAGEDGAPNRVAAGAIAGGRVSERLRFATGASYLRKGNGDYLLSSKSVLRYTQSKKFHLEFIGEVGISSDTIPKGIGASGFLRYNF